MKLTTFTSVSVALASLGSICVADTLGPNLTFARSPAGEISATRQHLGNLVEMLSGDAGHYASPQKCMQGTLVETVTPNTGRSTWDAPANITVQGQMVFVTFSHGAPFRKEITLENETIAANPGSSCLGSAYLKRITIAPLHYLSLVLPFKQASGDGVSLAARQQLLRASIAADPTVATVRLQDFGDSQYVEGLKSAIQAHQQSVGLVPDGWLSSVSFVGPSEMVDLRDTCRASLDPNNDGSESCVALAQTSDLLDSLYPETDAGLYDEQASTTPVLLTARTLEGFMSSTVVQP